MEPSRPASGTRMRSVNDFSAGDSSAAPGPLSIAAIHRVTRARSAPSPTKASAAKMTPTVIAIRPTTSNTSHLDLDDAAHPEDAQPEQSDANAEHHEPE